VRIAAELSFAASNTPATPVKQSTSHTSDSHPNRRQHCAAGGDVNEETKAVIVRAVQGMRAQEGARFKAHLRELQARWRARAEKDVSELQAVIQQYQARCPSSQPFLVVMYFQAPPLLAYRLHSMHM
jgi:hypothetical protein